VRAIIEVNKKTKYPTKAPGKKEPEKKITKTPPVGK
jgi:hypothetical protein